MIYHIVDNLLQLYKIYFYKWHILHLASLSNIFPSFHLVIDIHMFLCQLLLHQHIYNIFHHQPNLHFHFLLHFQVHRLCNFQFDMNNNFHYVRNKYLYISHILILKMHNMFLSNLLFDNHFQILSFFFFLFLYLVGYFRYLFHLLLNLQDHNKIHRLHCSFHMNNIVLSY